LRLLAANPLVAHLMAVEALLGVVVALIARYVDSDRAERLPEATASLVEYLLTPYIGGEETSTVLASVRKAG
jgi:hypothetical protein